MTSHCTLLKSVRSVVVAKDLFIFKLDIGPFGQRLSNEGFAVVDSRHHPIKVLTLVGTLTTRITHQSLTGTTLILYYVRT